ncbi:SDR family oxidoreductase [Arthrobacter mobilis]|uniref:SDR family oxidoreductase n=1 Tax=Arthrobacter mobilis TaxID=2724944 RepID=UPI00197B63E4|nr:SDR family oxidoreductase [Arthrobacter mobilis]
MSSRVVLVTGAARNLGAVAVRRLVADGHPVLPVDSCEGDRAGLPYPLATTADLDLLVAAAPDGAVVGHIADVHDRAGLATAVQTASTAGDGAMPWSPRLPSWPADNRWGETPAAGLAADLVGTGVTACAVSPRSTRTPMLAATGTLYDLPDVKAFVDHQLLRRRLDPDDIAATIAFCCSREAAALNGSIVHVDGGFSA